MQQDTFLNQFMQMDMPHLGIVVALVAIVSGVLMIVLIVASFQWRRVRVAEIEANLKMQMLEQGMTAEDIETVIDAGRKKRISWGRMADEYHRAKRKFAC